MFYLSESFLIDACKYLLSQSCTFSQFIIYNGVWCYKNIDVYLFLNAVRWLCVAHSSATERTRTRMNERGSKRVWSSVTWHKSVDSKYLRFFTRFLWCTAENSTHTHIDILNIIRIWLQINEALDGSFCYTSFHINFFSFSSESNPYYFILSVSFDSSIAFSCLFAQNVTIFRYSLHAFSYIYFVAEQNEVTDFVHIFWTGIWRRMKEKVWLKNYGSKLCSKYIWSTFYMFCEHWALLKNIRTYSTCMPSYIYYMYSNESIKYYSLLLYFDHI